MSTLPLPHLALPDFSGWWRRTREAANEKKAQVEASLAFEREQRTYLQNIVGDLDVRTHADCVELFYDGCTTYARTFVVAERPALVSAGMLEEVLFELGADVQVAVHVDPMSKGSAMRLLNGMRTTTTATMNDDAKAGTIASVETNSAFASAQQMVNMVFEDREALFGVTLAITIRAADRASLDLIERRLRTRTRSRLTLGGTRYQQRNGLLTSGVPYAHNHLGRRWTTNSSTLAMLWPFLQKPVGADDGARLAYSHADGSPVFIDPWAVEQGFNAGHGVIPAPNGAGKSVAAGAIIAELFARLHGPQIIIIDPIKGDFRRLVTELGGQTVYMSTRPDISLNPLDLPPRVYFSGTGEEAEQNPVLEQTRLVVGLLLMMARTNSEDGDAEDLVETAVLAAYHAKGIHEDDDTTWTEDPQKMPLLADVVAALGPEARTIKTRLARYLTGTLSGLLSRHTSLDVSGRLICFDLERTDARMKPVAVWLVTNWVWQRAKKDRSPRFLYLEEVKTLLEHPDLARMVAHLYSLGRAYKLAVWSATQLGTDYEETQEGRRALDNALTVLLMKQAKGAQWATERYGLAETDALYLETCERGDGLLVTPRDGGTYARIHVDPSPWVLELMGGPKSDENTL